MGSQHSGLLEWQNVEANAPGTIDGSRLTELMQALQRVARLQREAASASVYARQKKREVSFKRQDAWMSDARFMVEIQRLSAQGEFERFEELQNLAAQCQTSRDNLGPLEQEGIESEQEWEGHIWNLRQAEEQFFSDFEYEFQIAETHSGLESDAEHSAYDSSSDVGSGVSSETSQIRDRITLPQEELQTKITELTQRSQIELQSGDDPESHSLLGLTVSDQDAVALGDISFRSYSDVDDIDEELGEWQPGDLIKAPDSSQKSPPNNFELYPQLLNDFISRRDRINKWLEYTLQVSHLDGLSMFTILKDRLKTENKLVPSNWSQLVIAYWGIDEAASPGHPKPELAPEPDIDELPKTTLRQIPLLLGSENSQNTLQPFDLQSRRSCNTDHGYFSDTSKENPSFSASGFDASRTSRRHPGNTVDGGHRSQP